MNENEMDRKCSMNVTEVHIKVMQENLRLLETQSCTWEVNIKMVLKE